MPCEAEGVEETRWNSVSDELDQFVGVVPKLRADVSLMLEIGPSSIPEEGEDDVPGEAVTDGLILEVDGCA